MSVSTPSSDDGGGVACWVQVRDQTWSQGNRCLQLNHELGCPVRVVRGAEDPYVSVVSLPCSVGGSSLA